MPEFKDYHKSWLLHLGRSWAPGTVLDKIVTAPIVFIVLKFHLCVCLSVTGSQQKRFDLET